jgi:hypothetical protein
MPWSRTQGLGPRTFEHKDELEVGLKAERYVRHWTHSLRHDPEFEISMSW